MCTLSDDDDEIYIFNFFSCATICTTMMMMLRRWQQDDIASELRTVFVILPFCHKFRRQISGIFFFFRQLFYGNNNNFIPKFDVRVLISNRMQRTDSRLSIYKYRHTLIYSTYSFINSKMRYNFTCVFCTMHNCGNWEKRTVCMPS